MDIITLKQEPSQTVSVSLEGQSVTINLYQMPSCMYMDVFVDNLPICLGVPCLSFTKLVRYGYHGFVGDLFFIDYAADVTAIDVITLNGVDIPTSLPNYTLLNTRYALHYLSPND